MDGGMGREIERRGGPFRQPEWSALALYDRPSIVRDIHQAYIRAGAQFITTNSYAIVPFHLGIERYQRDGRALLDLSVDLALQAAQTTAAVRVVGSIPPICGSYEAENFDKDVAGPILDDFLDAFLGRVDVILLETVGSLREARFLLQRLRERNNGKNTTPVWISFYVQQEKAGQPARLVTGTSLTDTIEALRQDQLLDQVEAVLVNCCDMDAVDAALQELAVAAKNSNNHNHIHTAIGAYPNAFFRQAPTAAANETTRAVNHGLTPAQFAAQTTRWIRDYGATLVGGCCGIGPEHIQAMADCVAGRTPSSCNSTTAYPVTRGCSSRGCDCVARPKPSLVHG